MSMDDLKNKKRLGEMMTESLSPEDAAMNARDVPEDSENKSMYQEYLKPYFEEKMRQNEADFQHQQQVSADNSSIMGDKIKMALNPALQGPPQPGIFDERLPAEKEDQEKYMGMAMGTIGGAKPSAGKWKSADSFKSYLKNLEGHNAPAAAKEAAAVVPELKPVAENTLGYSSKWSSPEALEEYLQRLKAHGISTEGRLPKQAAALGELPGVVGTRDPEKLENASEMLMEILSRPGISEEQKQMALSKFSNLVIRANKFNK